MCVCVYLVSDAEVGPGMVAFFMMLLLTNCTHTHRDVNATYRLSYEKWSCSKDVPLCYKLSRGRHI